MSYQNLFEIYKKNCKEKNQDPSLLGFVKWRTASEISQKGHETKKNNHMEMEKPIIYEQVA